MPTVSYYIVSFLLYFVHCRALVSFLKKKSRVGRKVVKVKEWIGAAKQQGKYSNLGSAKEQVERRSSN